MGMKWSGYEADHALSSSAEVKNEWNCISASNMCLHGMQWDNFTFFLLQILCYLHIT